MNLLKCILALQIIFLFCNGAENDDELIILIRHFFYIHTPNTDEVNKHTQKQGQKPFHYSYRRTYLGDIKETCNTKAGTSINK